MKHPIKKRLLATGMIFSLSLPNGAYAQELIQNSETVDPLVYQMEGSWGFSSANPVTISALSSSSKQQDLKAGKGFIVDTEKQKDRFERNAVQFVSELETGNYGQALKQVSSTLRKSISQQWLESYWTSIIQQFEPQLGVFNGFGTAEVKGSNRVHTNIDVALQFENASLPFTIRMDKNGKVDDFLLNMATGFGPAASEPEYSHPNSFTEKEVVIGKGDFQLPGTLTIPKGKGPFPAVILVQGSGATDQDEAAYALKPFRDLAHGLASNGVAVLRYNKRTFEHAAKTIADASHTVDKETTDDALLALRVLEKERLIDDRQIYVMGHSLGGMMVPQILNADKKNKIAGAIVMAGPARTIQDVVLDQFEYFYSLGELSREEYEFNKGQFEMLNDPNFSGENPPEGFLLGQPVFWDSINDIRAAEMAREQHEPLLIIQGGRDYQVVSEIEIPIWQEKLAHRINVEYRLYPKLNHFFTEGEGAMSTPYEYFIPANIPEYVIDDLTEWIQAQPK